jgi:hypothetical protein
MSKMSDAMITIQEMIWQGFSAEQVSNITGFPLKWCIAEEDQVYAGDEMNEQSAQSFN